MYGSRLKQIFDFYTDFLTIMKKTLQEKGFEQKIDVLFKKNGNL